MKIAQNAGKETLTMLIVVLKQEVRITMPESKNNMQREGENISTIKPISRV